MKILKLVLSRTFKILSLAAVLLTAAMVADATTASESAPQREAVGSNPETNRTGAILRVVSEPRECPAVYNRDQGEYDGWLVGAIVALILFLGFFAFVL